MLCRSSDVSVEQLGAELGVSASLLYRWSGELSDSEATEGQPSYKELKKENRRLRRELDFLKQGFELFRVSTIDRYWFIDRKREHLSVVFTCVRLGLMRSKYCAWRDRGRESKRAGSDRRLLVMIRCLHQE